MRLSTDFAAIRQKLLTEGRYAAPRAADSLEGLDAVRFPASALPADPLRALAVAETEAYRDLADAPFIEDDHRRTITLSADRSANVCFRLDTALALATDATRPAAERFRGDLYLRRVLVDNPRAVKHPAWEHAVAHVTAQTLSGNEGAAVALEDVVHQSERTLARVAMFEKPVRDAKRAARAEGLEALRTYNAQDIARRAADIHVAIQDGAGLDRDTSSIIRDMVKNSTPRFDLNRGARFPRYFTRSRRPVR